METLVDSWRRLRVLLWKNSEPVTRTLIAVDVLTFLALFVTAYLLRGYPWWVWLQFSTFDFLEKPWTPITYPLVINDPLTLLFAGYWLWVVGGSLERAWSSRILFLFFVGISLITSLGIWVGGQLLQSIGLSGFDGIYASLNGLWMPLAALTVSWCLLNPGQVVLLGFILPVQGRHLMWVTIALTYILFVMSFAAPWLGFFALSGVGVAYLYTRHRTSASAYGIYERRQQRPPTIVERILDWLAFYWERFGRRRPWK